MVYLGESGGQKLHVNCQGHLAYLCLPHLKVLHPTTGASTIPRHQVASRTSPETGPTSQMLSRTTPTTIPRSGSVGDQPLLLLATNIALQTYLLAICGAHRCKPNANASNARDPAVFGPATLLSSRNVPKRAATLDWDNLVS